MITVHLFYKMLREAVLHLFLVAPLRVRSIKETSLTYHEKKNRTSLPVDSLFQKGEQTQQYRPKDHGA